jgi:hypothetical protein
MSLPITAINIHTFHNDSWLTFITWFQKLTLSWKARLWVYFIECSSRVDSTPDFFWKVQISYLGPDTDFMTEEFCCFPYKCQNCASNLTVTISFNILST